MTRTALRYGRVLPRPDEETLVAAPVAGRLLEVSAVLGADLSPGDLLLTLEPMVDRASRAGLQAQRHELEGQIAGARAQITAYESELARVTALVSSALATDAEQAKAQAALRSEQARMESLQRARAELSRAVSGRLALRAPASGVLSALNVEHGALVEPGTVLARIVRAGPRWIDLAVPPDDPVGSSYRVRTPGTALVAALLSKGAQVERDGTRRDRLEANGDASRELLPGATVAVEVVNTVSGVLVPVSAIVRRDLDALVFVEVEEGRFAAQEVQVAASDDTQAALSAGPEAGASVVARGATALLGELETSAHAKHAQVAE